MANNSLFGNTSTTVDYMTYPDTVDAAVNEKLRIRIHVDFKGDHDARISVVFLDVPFALRDWRVAYGTFGNKLSLKHNDYMVKWNGGSSQLLDYDQDWWTKVEMQVLRYMASQLKPHDPNKQQQQPAQQPAQQQQQPAAQPQQRPKVTFNAAAFNQQNGNAGAQEEPALTASDIVG